MNFSEALTKIKQGTKVQRAGWNGKGMWIALRGPQQIRVGEVFELIKAPMTLPYIYMKTADDQYVPWLASQTDILAEDWSLL